MGSSVAVVAHLMAVLGVMLLLFAGCSRRSTLVRRFSIAYVVLAVAAFGLAIAGIDPFHRGTSNRAVTAVSGIV